MKAPRQARSFLFEPLWLRDKGYREVIQKIWDRESINDNAKLFFVEKLDKVSGFWKMGESYLWEDPKEDQGFESGY